MAEMLSQAEINALLGIDFSPDTVSSSVSETDASNILTSNQVDILGEVGNISMGTAATTLSALLDQRVVISTPVVYVLSWKEISEKYDKPCVGVRIDYKVGLKGTNILFLENKDVKTITDLMMGGEGKINDEVIELSELDFSALGEAMNQMIGSASTSLALLIDEKIDIDTPLPFELNFSDDDFMKYIKAPKDEIVVAIFFRMQVGDLIDSVLVQALPIEFAIQLSEKLMIQFGFDANKESDVSKESVQHQQASESYIGGVGDMVQMPVSQPDAKVVQNINAQPAQFQTFDIAAVKQQKENIDILKDVPLEVTVELGKTSKRIKEILEFSPGTIIELDKLAGEPIDILINGKYVAKGEVVVIDENFAIRVTSIISSELRI